MTGERARASTAVTSGQPAEHLVVGLARDRLVDVEQRPPHGVEREDAALRREQEKTAVEAGRERATEQADVVVLRFVVVRQRGERAIEGVEQEGDLVGASVGLGHRGARPLEQGVERRQQVARERDRERSHADAQPDHHHRQDLHVAMLAGQGGGGEVDAQVVTLRRAVRAARTRSRGRPLRRPAPSRPSR